MKNLKIWLVASCLIVLASVINLGYVSQLNSDEATLIGVVGLLISVIYVYFVNGVNKNFEILNDKIDGKNK